MDTLLEYKCPCCGGALEFNSGVQKMKCPYCDTEFEMADLQALDESLKDDRPDEMNWETGSEKQWARGEAESIGLYVCQSCGGQIAADQNTGATSCPYCGNPVVMQGNFAGTLRPDLVIPFQVDKKDAMAALEKHLQGKRLLPRIFRDQKRIQEIKGVYVPFWLFDANADASIRYHGIRTRRWSDDDFDYQETRHYALLRSGKLHFDNIPADGSSKMPDDLMESIEPFDLTKAVDFQTAYLAGFLADKYDVPAEDCFQRIHDRAKKTTETAFRKTTGDFEQVTEEQSRISIGQGKVRYGLLPVWLLNTRWNGQTYSFAMNGQTGKFVGNLPVDKGAYWRWFAIVGGAGAAAAFAVLQLLQLF